MKKVLYIIGILLLCQHGFSQARVGLKAGVNYFVLSSKNNKLNDYSSGKAGYVVGATVDLPMNDLFSFQTELNFSSQNARGEYYGNTLKLTYIQIPILFKWHLPESKVAIYVGPQVGSLTTAQIKPKSGDKYGVTDDFTQTDVGISIGAMHIPLEPGITFDLRVYHSLVNGLKAEYDNGIKTKGTLISATFGYLFGRHK